MAFAVKGDRAFAERFMDSLRLVTIETHVADCHTCILHPASHTHRQLSEEALLAAGIDPNLMRLSIGLENADDLINDLENALTQAHNA
jgi:O-acetylhomoserine (thiol)-lyase